MSTFGVLCSVLQSKASTWPIGLVETCAWYALFAVLVFVSCPRPPFCLLHLIFLFLNVGNDQDTQHEAHSIKGAASNLMCHRMRLAALYMERAGQVGTRLKEGGSELARRIDISRSAAVASLDLRCAPKGHASKHFRCYRESVSTM